jgi:hypothetical protein
MPTKKTASLERLQEYVKFMIPRVDFLYGQAFLKAQVAKAHIHAEEAMEGVSAAD